jgi:hypothetical protein
MATESFTVTALPHSAADDADFHVALFIAPEIVPDAAGQLLGELSLFPEWGPIVAEDTAIELFDQSGTIECRALLDRIHPDEWKAVFPPDTPVDNRRGPDLADRRWRSFRPALLHDAAKLLHGAAMFADPTSPPLPTRHPLSETVVSYLRQHEVMRERYDESLVTELLDRGIGEFRGSDLNLLALEHRLDGMGGFDRFALELHRARRFYERPESALPYQARPTDGATMPKLAPPTPDFHERVALAGDHPALLRRLGLVVELRVADPARLKKSQWLSARVVPRRDRRAGRLTRVRCEAAGDALVTVPETADWHQGRLRLGDTDRFSVLDMDPDGAALKLDRFVWTLPRLLAVEQNGDPIHAAPTALRATGLTVARSGRARTSVERQDRQTALQAQLNAGRPPLLSTEDVTRGVRVEVWDEEAGTWSTLHARLIDLDVFGLGQVLKDVPEEGFIQGTAATETAGVEDSPIHVHESMFGWDGWSLSAPKPGLRVRHVSPPVPGPDGQPVTEVVEPVTETPLPDRPVVVTNQVAPGTLPRLRYGRSYAFRAWAVDLAGNSRPHLLGAAGAPSAAFSSAVASLMATVTPPTVGVHLVSPLRSALLAGLVDGVAGDGFAPAAPEPELPDLIGDRDADRLILTRLRQRREGRPGPTADSGRAAIVGRAFRAVVADPATPLVADTRVVEPAALSAMLAAHGLAGVLGPALAVEAATVSPLRPFLRWDPVGPPVVVTKHRFSPGESLRHVVIRSGVTQDLATLDITVTPPADYAPANPSSGYRETSERHVAPPKTSQVEAELHGEFDDAIGSADPAVHRQFAAVALREAGTLFDLGVPRLDDPSVVEPQLEVSLERDATVSPVEAKTLPLAPGEAPAPGQYVVHGVDDLNLPYLPDVPARGISLVFQEAGRDRAIGYPFGVEGFTARYGGEWPVRDPFRLVLRGAAELGGRLTGRVLEIALPPGDQQCFRLSSALDRDDLALLGLWRSLPAVIRNDPDIAEAAADGWLWAFTPFDDVTLVHAVPRPLEAPRPTVLRPGPRAEGSVEVPVHGAVDVHGPSTDSLTLEARWSDTVDDLSLPGPEAREERGVAYTTAVHEFEDLAILANADLQFDLPWVGPVRMHRSVHRFGDTKHRMVRYRFRASTRFREYFDAATLAPVPADPDAPPDPDRPEDDGRSVVGPVHVLDVPSSARPAAPVVHSVVPLFLWDEATEPEQPMAVRRRRRAGVRIYLERPWYSSGAGELLGVLLAVGGVDNDDMTWVSQWGGDPVWVGAPVARRAMFLELPDVLHATGLDDRPGDAIAVTTPVQRPLRALPGSPDVTVLGYRPQYNEERQLWYADVAIDPRDAFWPFVRLAVARYQPSSINGCHLSVPVRCDFVQVTPERTASVSRIDDRHVRVVLSGPVGARLSPPDFAGPVSEPLASFAARVSANRTVVARLQRRDPAIPTDLGWETVATRALPVQGHGRNVHEAAWVGVLDATEVIPLVRPGTNQDWRVTIEEWEHLQGDPVDLGDPHGAPVWEHRIIYADEISL